MKKPQGIPMPLPDVRGGRMVGQRRTVAPATAWEMRKARAVEMINRTEAEAMGWMGVMNQIGVSLVEKGEAFVDVQVPEGGAHVLRLLGYSVTDTGNGLRVSLMEPDPTLSLRLQ